MKVLLSWLADFVDVPVEPARLADDLIMRGLEVAGVEPVESLAPPPWLASSPTLGSSAVIDLEITANRPDCLSVLGIAREVATIYGKPLRVPAVQASPGLMLDDVSIGENDAVQVLLEEPVLCPRYSAAVADVRVLPSPAWLAARLHAAGLRPINNIVDLTNYVLIELGQPMHAFDLARLAGPALKIRRARPDERLQTIDGQDRVLTRDMLVIADADQAQAIAGVMGGARSEVGSSTRRVVFESACFEPRTVRRTSRSLGLKTEASARFERGADIGAPVTGLRRAAALLAMAGGGHMSGPAVDRYPTPAGPRHVTLRRDRVGMLVGQDVPARDVERILTGLGFGPTRVTDGWHVSVPTSRVDVAREADIIEEVARHYGYDRLPLSFPVLRGSAAAPDVRIPRDQLVRRVLAAAGFFEAVTFAFIEEAAATAFAAGPDDDSVPIDNPLSGKFAVLRPSLMPGLLESIAHNLNHQQPDVRLFEIGSRFSRSEGESRGVALMWTGAAGGHHWSSPPRSVDLFDVKGVAELLGEALELTIRFEPGICPYLVAGRTAVIGDDASGRRLGLLGQVAPGVAMSRGVPRGAEVYAAELDLDQAWFLAEGAVSGARSSIVRAIRPLPRYPAMVRDLSILVASTLPAASVRGTIVTAAPDTLQHVREFDRYSGKGIPDGQVSLSYRLTFQSPERTLTDTEIQRAMESIVVALERDHRAVQR